MAAEADLQHSRHVHLHTNKKEGKERGREGRKGQSYLYESPPHLLGNHTVVCMAAIHQPRQEVRGSQGELSHQSVSNQLHVMKNV